MNHKKKPRPQKKNPLAEYRGKCKRYVRGKMEIYGFQQIKGLLNIIQKQNKRSGIIYLLGKEKKTTTGSACILRWRASLLNDNTI